jgi:hypothetical protein
MKKFILSSVLMLGLTFAANANTTEMPAPVIRAEFFSYSDFCAWYVAALFDRYNLDTSTAFGFAMYQAVRSRLHYKDCSKPTVIITI